MVVGGAIVITAEVQIGCLRQLAFGHLRELRMHSFKLIMAIFYWHFSSATDIYGQEKSALFLWAAHKNTGGWQH